MMDSMDSLSAVSQRLRHDWHGMQNVEDCVYGNVASHHVTTGVHSTVTTDQRP